MVIPCTPNKVTSYKLQGLTTEQKFTPEEQSNYVSVGKKNERVRSFQGNIGLSSLRVKTSLLIEFIPQGRHVRMQDVTFDDFVIHMEIYMLQNAIGL